VHAEVYDVLVFDLYQSKIKSHTRAEKPNISCHFYTRSCSSNAKVRSC